MTARLDDPIQSVFDQMNYQNRLISRALAAERKLERAEQFIERLGYRRCDAAACNCGLWHRDRSDAR